MKRNEPQHKTPSGTIILMIVFIILLIALWGSAYLTMLARGATF